jgi:hypothetical protein
MAPSTPAAEHELVRRVDDRIDLKPDDVAEFDLQHRHASRHLDALRITRSVAARLSCLPISQSR